MSADNIKVVIKARPLLKREKDNKLLNQWIIKNNTIQQIENQAEPFVFDHIFDQNATNQELFDIVAKPIIDASIGGFNGTIFAYGQTSSGKTYTMLGEEKNPGIVSLAAQQIFNAIEVSHERAFLVRVGYIEIYNEKVFDLLDKKDHDLKIHDTANGDTTVMCTERIITTKDEILDVLYQGNKNRKIGETHMNERSSRSHAIFRIIIESREMDKPVEEATIQISYLNLVDLAGSERADQTGACGSRLKEGGHINKSLLSLSVVMNKLSDNDSDKTYINYRDSKLTRLLQASLGGNALTAIICTITTIAIDETYSTLNFALRAKSVKNKPQINQVLSDAAMMKKLERQIARLEEELRTEKKKNSQIRVASLEQQIKEQELKFLHSRYSTKCPGDKGRRRTWCSSTTSPGTPVSSKSPMARKSETIFDTPKSDKLKVLEKEFDELQEFTNLENKLGIEYEPLKPLNERLTEVSESLSKCQFQLLERENRLEQEQNRCLALETRIFDLEVGISHLRKIENDLKSKISEQSKEIVVLQRTKNDAISLDFQFQQQKKMSKVRENELLDLLKEKDNMIAGLEGQNNLLINAAQLSKDEISKLHEASNILNQEISRLKQQMVANSSLESELSELRLKYEAADKKTASIVEDLRKLKTEKERVQSECEELSSQLVDSIQDFDKLKSDYDKTKSDFENSLKNKESLSSTLAEKEAEIALLLQEIESLKKKNDSPIQAPIKIEILEQDANCGDSEINLVSTSSNEQEIHLLKSQLETLKLECHDIKLEASTVQNGQVDQSLALAERDSEIKSLKTELAALNSEKLELIQLRSTFDEMKKQYDEKLLCIGEKEKEIELLREDVELLKLKCDEIRIENDKLQHSLDSQEDSLASREEEISSLEEPAMLELQANISAIVREKQDLTKEIEDLRQELRSFTELKVEHNTIIEQFKTANEQVSELRQAQEEFTKYQENQVELIRNKDTRIKQLEAQLMSSTVLDTTVNDIELNRLQNEISEQNEYIRDSNQKLHEQKMKIEAMTMESKNLNSLLSASEELCKTLKSEKEKIEEEAKSTKESIATIEIEKNEQQIKIEAISKDLSTLRDSLSSREKKCENLESEKRDKENEIIVLKDSLSSIQNEINDREMKLQSIRTEFEQIYSSLLSFEAICKNLEIEKQDKDKQINSLKESLDAIQIEKDEQNLKSELILKEVEELRSLLYNLEIKCETVESEKKTKNEENQRLMESISLLKNEISLKSADMEPICAEQTKEIVLLKQRNNELNDENKKISKEKLDLEQQIGENLKQAEDECVSLRKSMDKLTETIELLETGRNELLDEKILNEKTITSLNQELVIIKSQVTSLKSENLVFQDKYDANEAEKNALEKQVSQYVEDIKRIKVENQLLRDEIESLKKQINYQKTQKSELQAEFESKYADKCRMVEDLKSLNEKAEKDIENFNTTINGYIEKNKQYQELIDKSKEDMIRVLKEKNHLDEELVKAKSNLEAELSRVANAKGDVEAKIEGLMKEKCDLKTELARMVKEKNDLQLESVRIEKGKTKLEAELDCKVKEISVLQISIEKSSSELFLLKKANDKNLAALNDLREQTKNECSTRADLERKVSKLQEDFNNITEQNKISIKHLEETQKQLEAINSKYSAARTENKNLLNDVEMLTKEKQNLNQICGDMRMEQSFQKKSRDVLQQQITSITNEKQDLLKQLDEMQQLHATKIKQMESAITNLEKNNVELFNDQSKLTEILQKTEDNLIKFKEKYDNLKAELNSVYQTRRSEQSFTEKEHKIEELQARLHNITEERDECLNRQTVINTLIGENNQLKMKNQTLTFEVDDLRKMSQQERKFRRQSTHDEKRKSLWDDDSHDIGIMTEPTDKLCACEELNKKLIALKRDLKIKDCQINTLVLQSKSNPLKDEVETFKKMVIEGEAEHNKLRMEITRLKERLYQQHTLNAAIKECQKCAERSVKIFLDQESQTILDNTEIVNIEFKLEECGSGLVNKVSKEDLIQKYGKLERKNEDLKKLCRMRMEKIKSFENKEKENQANNLQNDQVVPLKDFKRLETSYETLKKEFDVLKKKYEELKAAYISKREEIQKLQRNGRMEI